IERERFQLRLIGEVGRGSVGPITGAHLEARFSDRRFVTDATVGATSNGASDLFFLPQMQSSASARYHPSARMQVFF
ncbi:hypothetical protein WAJ69_22790, partial [Acinetobacter baumannii]